MKNNNQYNQLDERQKQIRAKSTQITLIFVLLCLGVAMVYRMATTDEMGWEFWVLIGACFVSLVAKRIFGDIEAPKDMFGKPLPLGNTKADKKVRRKEYFLQSLIFGGACTVMDIILMVAGKNDSVDQELTELIFPNLNKIATVVITAIIAFAVAFVISYVFEYLIGEKYRVKKYNELMAELDAEDEDE